MSMSGAGFPIDRNQKDEKRPEGRFNLLTAIITSVAVTVLVLVTAGAGVLAYAVVAYMMDVREEHEKHLAEHDQKLGEWEKVDLEKINVLSADHEARLSARERADGEVALARCLAFTPILRMSRKYLEQQIVLVDQIAGANRKSDRLGYADWSEHDRHRHDYLVRWFQVYAQEYNRAVAEYEGMKLEAARYNPRAVTALETFAPVSLEIRSVIG